MTFKPRLMCITSMLMTSLPGCDITSCTHNPLLPELPINVALNLKRHEREWFDHVEQMATFVCKTSKSAVEVTWYKDKEELKAGSKYELRHIGREHIMTVHELCMSDYGDYVVAIRSLRKMPHAPVAVGLYHILFLLFHFFMYINYILFACVLICLLRNFL